MSTGGHMPAPHAPPTSIRPSHRNCPAPRQGIERDPSASSEVDKAAVSLSEPTKLYIICREMCIGIYKICWYSEISQSALPRPSNPGYVTAKWTWAAVVRRRQLGTNERGQMINWCPGNNTPRLLTLTASRHRTLFISVSSEQQIMWLIACRALQAP